MLIFFFLFFCGVFGGGTAEMLIFWLSSLLGLFRVEKWSGSRRSALNFRLIFLEGGREGKGRCKTIHD